MTNEKENKRDFLWKNGYFYLVVGIILALIQLKNSSIIKQRNADYVWIFAIYFLGIAIIEFIYRFDLMKVTKIADIYFIPSILIALLGIIFCKVWITKIVLVIVALAFTIPIIFKRKTLLSDLKLEQFELNNKEKSNKRA
ncbi:MAG: hypothetical protein DRH57_03250 [Candidatus Cloacimonadota bacterium]|nr:MAG: hypothetical protein DRH57_03250 [Candidatus Cloacimonadota bacterium]